jgi:hypothetical protein
VLNHLEYDGKFDAILRELKALAKWVLNGGMAGAVTHILGDLPTMGDGGFAALKLFYPISRRRFNLRLVKAGSRLFNTVTTYIGAFITATAWVGIGAHLVAPSLPEASFKTLCSKVGSLAWKAITRGATSLRETAMDALARMKNVLTDAWKTTGTSLSSLYHRTRVRLQHLLDTPETTWYPDPNPNVGSNAAIG